MTAAVTTLVLGLGNLVMQDDGAGVHVVRHLCERYRFPEDISIVDGGTLGLDLLPMFEGVDRLIVVDAVDCGVEPGGLVRLAGDDVPVALATKVSPHQMGLKDLLAVADLQGILPGEVVLIGIQPASTEMGMELSPGVSSGMAGVEALVLEELAGWGITPLR